MFLKITNLLFRKSAYKITDIFMKLHFNILNNTFLCFIKNTIYFVICFFSSLVCFLRFLLFFLGFLFSEPHTQRPSAFVRYSAVSSR